MYRYLLLPLLFLLAACATTKTTAPAAAPLSYAGTWEVTVSDTPMGTVTGDLSLIDDGAGNLSGTFDASGEQLVLSYAKSTDAGLEVVFYYPDYSTDVNIKLAGKASDATLIGQTMGQFATVATRKGQ